MANGNNKLTEEERKQVLFYFNEIQLPMKQNAEKFNVSYDSISRLLTEELAKYNNINISDSRNTTGSCY